MASQDSDNDSFAGDFNTDDFWDEALEVPLDLNEEAKKEVIADQAGQDAPTSHVIQDDPISQEDFTTAHKRLRETIRPTPQTTPQTTPAGSFGKVDDPNPKALDKFLAAWRRFVAVDAHE